MKMCNAITRKRLSSLFWGLLVSLFSTLFTDSASAAIYQYYWKDGAGNGRWDWGSSQWWGTQTSGFVGAPIYDGGAQIYFENTGGQTTYINAGAASGGYVKLNSVFAAANSTGRTYTVSTENGIAGIDLYSKIETISGGGALTFNSGAAVRLAATSEINAVGGALTLNDLNLNGQTLNSYGSSTLAINGVISGTGTYNIKNQGLDVTYSGSGANTFNGTTTVEDTSALYLNKSANTAAIGGQLVINSGATVRTDAAGQLNKQLVTVNGTLNLNNNDQETALEGSGTVTLGSATLTINMTMTDTFSGVIAGTGGVIKTGTGNQILSGANTYTGATTITTGTLSLGGTGPSTIAGNITINGGSLQYSNTTNNQIADTSNITLSSGTLALGARSETINALTITGGALTISSGTFSLGAASSITGGNLSITAGGGKLATGGTLTLGNTTLDYTSATANNNVIGLGGGITVNASSTANIKNSGAGASRMNLNDAARVFDVGASGNLNIDLVVWSSTASSGAITKNGTGTLTLNATSTYTGGTTINAGTLVLGHATDTLSGGGAVTINGGTLSLGANSDTVGTVTLSGGSITGSTGVLTGSGTYALQSGTASAILGGAISANKTTAGTVTLSGANTFSGGLRLSEGQINLNSAAAPGTGTLTLVGGTLDNTSAGAITLSNNNVQSWNGDFTFGGTQNLNLGTGAVTMNATRAVTVSAGTLTVGGAIGGATFGLTKNGTGTLALNGANTYTGTTTINAGTLSLGTSNGLADASSVTLAGGELGLGAFTDTVSGFTMTGGTLAGSGTLTASTYALQGGTVNANLGAGTATVTTDTTTLVGTLGATTLNINTGNLTLASTNRLADGATVTVAGGILNAGANTDTVTTLNMSSGSIVGSGTLTATTYGLSGGTVAGALGAGTANVSNTVSLTGTMAATTINILNTGNLSLGSANRIADSTSVAVSAGGVLTLNDNSETLGELSGAGNIALGAGTLTTNSSSTTTVSGTISGTGGALTKEGSGTLILSANNTYTGTTTISAGTLQLGSGSTGGTLAGNITNNAALVFDRSNSFTFAGIISGSGSVTKNGVNTLKLSGANTYTGATTINSGAIELAADNAIGSSSVVTIAGGQLSLVAYYATLDSLIMTSGTLARGGRVLTLNNASSFTGGTVNMTSGSARIVTSATTTLGDVTFTTGSSMTAGNGLVLGGNVAMSSGTANFVITGGAGRIDLGGATREFALSDATLNAGWGIVNGTGLTKSGNGTLALTATNTYTGTTTISGGTLSISGGAAIVDAGTVSLDNTAGVVFSVLGSETIASLQGGGATGGEVALAGGQTLTVAETGTNSFNGSITGTGNLVKSGVGTLTLAGTSTYSGATTISAGKLVVNGSAANSAITIGSTGILGGSGTTGAVTVQSGGRIAPGNSPGTLSVSTLTLEGAGGYNWEITNVAGTPGTEWDLISVGGGTGAVTINATSGSPFTIYIAGNPTGWSPSTSFNWNIIDWGTVTGFDANAFAVDTTSFTGATPTGTWALANSGGFLNLAYTAGGDPTWAGGTGNWDAGFSPAITDNQNLFFTGVGGTATNNVASGTVDEMAALTFNATAGAYTLAANSGSAGYDAATSFTLNGNIVNNSSAAQTISLALTSATTRTYDAASGNITLGGVIAGTGGLTKNGSHTVTLGAANTFTGGVIVNTGTLSTSIANALAATTNATVNSDGTLRFGADNEIATLNGTGTVSIAAGTLTINSSSNSSLSGLLTGSGALTKNGSGTLTLSGDNTLSGSVSLVAGTLALGHNNALGTGSLTIGKASTIQSADASDLTISNALGDVSGSGWYGSFGTADTGNLTFSSTDSVSLGTGIRTFNVNNTQTTFASTFTGSGGITKGGTGSLLLTGNSTYTGLTTINAGNFTISGGSALADNAPVTLANTAGVGFKVNTSETIGALSGGGATGGTVTLGGGVTLTVNQTTDTTFSGTITGAGGTLAKDGTGKLTLAGANTFTGTTTVSAGTLEAAAANALGSTSSIVVNTGGSLLVTADDAIGTSTDVTLASTTTGNGTVASLAFSGTYNGTVGALTLSTDSIIDLGEGSVVIHFASIAMNAHALDIYNWTGTTLWNGGDGNNTDQFYVDESLSTSDLSRISFYSSLDSNSFLGTGYQILSGSYEHEILPVPEPETFATAALLLLGLVWHLSKSQAGQSLRAGFQRKFQPHVS